MNLTRAQWARGRYRRVAKTKADKTRTLTRLRKRGYTRISVRCRTVGGWLIRADRPPTRPSAKTALGAAVAKLIQDFKVTPEDKLHLPAAILHIQYACGINFDTVCSLTDALDLFGKQLSTDPGVQAGIIAVIRTKKQAMRMFGVLKK